MNHKYTSSIIGCVLLLVLPVAAFSQDIVLHRYESTDPRSQIEKIIYLSAGLSLQQHGISSSRVASEPDYLLLTNYSIDNLYLTADLLLQTAEGIPISRFELQSPLDIGIEDRLAHAVTQLLEQADVIFRTDDAASIHGVVSEPVKPPAPPAPPAQSRWQYQGLIVGGSAGAGIFSGEGREYFHSAISTSIRVVLEWEHESVSLSGGIQTFTARAFTRPELSGGNLYINSTGLSSVLRLSGPLYSRWSVAASSGAAVIMIARVTETVAKTVPYTEISTGVSLPIGTSLDIGMEIRLHTVFDQEFPVILILPALTIRKEL